MKLAKSKSAVKRERHATFAKLTSRVTDIVDEVVEGPMTRKKKALKDTKKVEEDILKKRKPAGRLSVDLGNRTNGKSLMEITAQLSSAQLHDSAHGKSSPSSRNASSKSNYGDAFAKYKTHEEVKELYRASRKATFLYMFDLFINKRVGAVGMGLVIWMLFQIGIGGLTFALVDRFRKPKWSEYMWVSFNLMADPGTMTASSAIWQTDPDLWGQRIITSLITLGGIGFFAVVVGFVVETINEKMEEIKKGRTPLVESGHTVIINWTDRTLFLIDELCEAFNDYGGGVIVLLSEAGKDVIQTEIDMQIPNTKGTRIMVRTGSPLVMQDLLMVSAHTAKSIVVLSLQGNADRADALSLNTLLNLKSVKYGLQGHVIVEVRDIDNEALITTVGGDNVETVVSHDILGRLMLMSARRPGLANVYAELLGFEGDEFYMTEYPQLVGVSFGKLIDYFDDAIPVGIQLQNGDIFLKPPIKRLVGKGERVIVIAEDHSYTCKKELPDRYLADPGTAPPEKERKSEIENILFFGWRRDIRDVLVHLDQLAVPGSTVTLMTDSVPIDERDAKLLEEGFDVNTLQNISMVHAAGNTAVRRKLEMLPIESFTACMIFADEAYEDDIMHSDSHSMATLLLVRDIQHQRQAERHQEKLGTNSMRGSMNLARWMHKAKKTDSCPIVCEILDPRTQKTISANQVISTASDFCESNKLVAALLSMIAEERDVKVLLDELLGIGGCNLSLRPARNYCRPDEEISFNALSKRALQSGQILLGYQHQGKEKRRAGVAEARKTINPTHKRELQGGWSEYDMVVLEGEAIGFDYDEAQKEEAANNSAKRSMNILGALGGGGFGGRGRPNLLSAFKEREQRKGLADIGKERRMNAKAKGARDQFQHVLHTHQKLKQIGKSKSAKKNIFAGGGGVNFKVGSLADEEGQGLSGQEEQEAREKAIEKQDQIFEKMRRRKSSFAVAGKKETMSEERKASVHALLGTGGVEASGGAVGLNPSTVQAMLRIASLKGEMRGVETDTEEEREVETDTEEEEEGGGGGSRVARKETKKKKLSSPGPSPKPSPRSSPKVKVDQSQSTFNSDSPAPLVKQNTVGSLEADAFLARISGQVPEAAAAAAAAAAA
eukprot:CAMPEP_0182558640 /NCGR_PEP_ID=MMETSP1324-20130603/2070_1 /TAXON_ID=236786 /ORGANISM="Florenciella sp., Strain RCC1587" /LENGTH=1117 /DNA_ID=CAMNT_0024770819 /DNA_START=443 /DNA_END=3792 /DNA_ORIENTATION=+